MLRVGRWIDCGSMDCSEDVLFRTGFHRFLEGDGFGFGFTRWEVLNIFDHGPPLFGEFAGVDLADFRHVIFSGGTVFREDVHRP